MANPDVARAFVESGGEKAKMPPKPKKTTRRRYRIRAVSDKQALENAKWAGIREAFIYLLNKLDPDGAHCEQCGARRCRLDLDHIRPRSQGGRSVPSNARLLCRSCHTARHGEPQWSAQSPERMRG